MNNRFLIIPDIHLEHERAEAIIARYPGFQVLFLGDYFDAFNDSVSGHVNTAKWLAWSVQQKDRTHLLGNHDPYYFTGKRFCECPGNSQEKYEGGRQHLIPEIWFSMRTHFWLRSNFLATHAGLSRSQAHPVLPQDEFLAKQEEQFKAACQHNLDHPWLDWGTRRQGSTRIAGPLWCDWGVFKPIPGLHQVFGHSPREKPKVRFAEGWNINLDSPVRISYKKTTNQLVRRVVDGMKLHYPGSYAVLDENTLFMFGDDGKLGRKLNL